MTCGQLGAVTEKIELIKNKFNSGNKPNNEPTSGNTADESRLKQVCKDRPPSVEAEQRKRSEIGDGKSTYVFGDKNN